MSDETIRDDNGDAGRDSIVSRAVLGGIPWAVASKVILLFVYTVVSYITWNWLGASEYGVLAKCRTLAEILVVLCGLGLNTTMSRFIPELQVKGSKRGLLRLVRTTSAWEGLSLVGCAILLFLAKPLLDRYYFGIDPYAEMPLLRWYFDSHGVAFGGSTALLWAILFFVAVRAVRNYLEVILTALYQISTTAILSAVQGIILVGFLYVSLQPESMRLAGVALTAQSVAMTLVSIYGIYWLVRYITNLRWSGGNDEVISSKRLFSLSWASLLNQSGQLIMQRYSEVTFLSIFAADAVVGIYDVGVGQTQMILTLLPFAVHGLFTSAFSEAYTRDPDCLGRLIRTYYKVLILVILPMSAFGAFFSDEIFAIFFESPGNQAGQVASWFFVIHILGFLSVPLSMAIIAKEKVLAMTPLLYLQIVVNLILDYTLIPRYEILGATAAVILTFVLTIPVRLYVARRIIGGIYFPLGFFARYAVVLYGGAWGLSWFAPHITAQVEALLAPLVSSETLSIVSQYGGLAAVVPLGVVYVMLYVLAMRYLRLFTHEDAVEFRKMNIRALDRVLDLVVGKRQE